MDFDNFREQLAKFKFPPERRIDTKEREDRIRATDPRDYIPEAFFAKRAQEIDPDPDHPWAEASSAFLAEDRYGAVAASFESPPDPASKGKVLLAAKDREGAPVSLYEEFDGDACDHIIRYAQKACLYLPAEIRQQYVREIVSAAPDMKTAESDEVLELCASSLLKKIPDLPDASAAPMVELPAAGESRASREQQEIFNRILAQAAQKIPADVLSRKLEGLLKMIPVTDDVYGKNYRQIIDEASRWVFEGRNDLRPQYHLFQYQDKVKRFPTDGFSKRHPTKPEEFTKILSRLPVESEPPLESFRGRPRSKPKAEFVDVGKIVGGPGIRNWAEISTAPGRGLDKVMGISEAMFQGSLNASSTEPISIYEHDGKYFVGSDGRHRVAGLKALDVAFYPMMVERLEGSEEDVA